jgi:hypothetical protein
MHVRRVLWGISGHTQEAAQYKLCVWLDLFLNDLERKSDPFDMRGRSRALVPALDLCVPLCIMGFSLGAFTPLQYMRMVFVLWSR